MVFQRRIVRRTLMGLSPGREKEPRDAVRRLSPPRFRESRIGLLTLIPFLCGHSDGR